jgi:hypothetical protein
MSDKRLVFDWLANDVLHVRIDVRIPTSALTSPRYCGLEMFKRKIPSSSLCFKQIRAHLRVPLSHGVKSGVVVQYQEHFAYASSETTPLET